jgi:hypothetical protein
MDGMEGMKKDGIDLTRTWSETEWILSLGEERTGKGMEGRWMEWNGILHYLKCLAIIILKQHQTVRHFIKSNLAKID